MIERLFINRFATITELTDMPIPVLYKWFKYWKIADKNEQNYNADEAAKIAALTR